MAAAYEYPCAQRLAQVEVLGQTGSRKRHVEESHEALSSQRKESRGVAASGVV